MARPGRPSIYPWDHWMDGQTHTLIADRDFHVRSDVMQRMVRNEARRRGLANLRTRVLGDELKIFYRVRRSQEYPWGRWLDGELHILRQGRDFHCSIDSLRRQAYRAAANRGMTLAGTRSRRSPEGYVEFALRAAAARDAVPLPSSQVD